MLGNPVKTVAGPSKGGLRLGPFVCAQARTLPFGPHVKI